MILAAVNLLERNPHPSETEIREGLAGNLCRCTGYTKIFESVVAACRATPPHRGAAALRSYVPAYQMETPRDLSDALERMAREPGAWKPFAGGTDLMVLLEAGKLSHRQLPEHLEIAGTTRHRRDARRT